MRHLPILLLVFLPVGSLLGQEPLSRFQEEEAHTYPYHALDLMLLHVNVREGVVEGSPRWLGLPGWSLDYSLVLNPRWSIGLHTDLIFEEFLVVKTLANGEEEEAIERSFPVAPAVIASWEAVPKLFILLGQGVEFAPGENLALTRVGLEFATPLRNGDWEFLATVQYDLRYGAYDTFMLGVGVARLFGHKRKE